MQVEMQRAVVNSLIDLPLGIPEGIPNNIYDIHVELCRLLMRPGESVRRYLFSVEYELGEIVVVRSNNLPFELREAGFPVEIPAAGSRRRFRLAASPMRSRSGKKQRLPVGDAKSRIDWLRERGNDAGFTLVDNPEVSWRTIVIHRKGVDIMMERAIFTGILEVTDQSALEVAMTDGVGRGRAWGFGLLQLFDLLPEDRSHA